MSNSWQSWAAEIPAVDKQGQKGQPEQAGWVDREKTLDCTEKENEAHRLGIRPFHENWQGGKNGL